MDKINRIAIIGISGTGKSRLACLLEQKLKLPLTHYDQLVWKENWTEVPEDKVKSKILGSIASEQWIFEGYLFPAGTERLERAEVIIYLDFSGWEAFWGGVQRWLKNRGKERPEMAKGCAEKFDWEYLKVMWHRKERPAIERAIQGHEQKIVRLCSRADLRKFCQNIRSIT